MWNNLKASIAAVVRTNNNQEITGANLQNVLNTIVNSVGANATFAGVATPSTSPGTPDGPVFYIAGQSGQYSNFGNQTVTVGTATLGIFLWNGSVWSYIPVIISGVTSVMAALSYAACSTKNSTAAKSVNISGYELISGGSMKIKMQNANTAASNVTLNISGTGAIPLYYERELASASNSWEAGEVLDVYYDGTNYYANSVAGGGKFNTGERVRELGIDSEPISGSANLVQSGGVYQEIAEQIFNQFGERLGVAPITTEITQNKCSFGPVENGSSTIISRSDGGHRVAYVRGVKKGSVIHFTGTTSTTREQYYGASQVEPSDTVVGMTIDHVSVISSNGNHDDYFIMPYDGVFFYGYYNSGWSDRLFNIAEPKLKTNLDVSNILEIGGITFYGNGRWTYSNSTTRLRLKVDKLLFLNSGDKIKLSSYNGARMYIAYRCIDGTTGSTGWITKDYIVEVAGQYSLILSYNPETATDIEELSERLEIWSQSSSIPSFDEFWRTKVFNFVYGISGRKEGLELDTSAKTLTIPANTTLILKNPQKEAVYENIVENVVVSFASVVSSTTAIVIAYNLTNKTFQAYSYSQYRATDDNFIVACVRFQSTGGNYTISSLLPYSINGSKFGVEYNRAVGIGGKSIYIDYCPLRKTVTIPSDAVLYMKKGGVEVVVTTPNNSDTVVDLSSISSSAIVIYYNNTAGAFGACAYNQYNKGNWFYVAGIRTMKSGYNNSFTSPFAWSINGKPFGLGRKQIRCNTGVKIMAHRGAHFANAPENSLDSYRLAGYMGYDWVETDFCPTSDGVLVLMHDDTINRTMRNKSDYSEIQETVTVASKTYSELRNDYVLASDDVRMRRPIPTLEEYFKTCRESGVFPVAEIKSYRITEQHILEAFEMGRAILGDGNFGFASTAQALLDYARTLSDKIPLLYLGISILNTTSAAGVSRNHPVNIWYPSYSGVITEDVIAEYKDNGMKVGLWLLGSYANNFDVMQKVGAEIICCDAMAPSIKSSYGIVYNLEDFMTTGTIDGNVVKLNTNQRISLYTTNEKLGIYYLSIVGKGNYSVVAPKLSAGNTVDNATPQRNVWQGIIDNNTINVEVKALADGAEIEFVNYCVLPVDF